MKTLTVTALVCALMVLSSATPLLPALYEDQAGALMALTNATALLPASDEDQADTENTVLFKKWACPSGWTRIGSRCFCYVPSAKTWALAERHCMSMGAHLASIHSASEYNGIQRMIAANTYNYREAWVGGSDAQQNGIWLWSDGSKFHFSNWCPGEPNNLGGQDCLHILFYGTKCWDDYQCGYHKPFVCAMPPK